jgi:Galactose oxidase, central domain
MANQFWLYGGLDASNQILSDLWSFSPLDRTWHAKTLQQGPGPVFDMPCWTSAATNRLFLYANTTIWSYHIIDNVWTTYNSSGGPIVDAWSSFAQVDDRLYIFTASGKFWRFSIEAFTWTPLVIGGPSARANGHLFPTRDHNAVLFFGGLQGSQEYQDFWSYAPNTDTWTELADTVRPPKRYGGGVARDDQGSVYILGGGSNYHADIWKYGPESGLQDLLDSIKFNLDSATLSSLWAASMSTIVLIMLIALFIVLCVQRCKRKRRDFLQGVGVRNSNEENNDL